MATYITTVRFRDQGLKGIQETTKRAAAFKASARKLGAKVTDVFWTLGAFDGLVILEAPDDDTVTAAMLHLGSQGNVQTTTVRAYNATEMDKILAKLTA
jgi:uncharacterized protein with GYD domain